MRILSILLQLLGAVVVLGICAGAVLGLTALPRVSANPVQKGPIVVALLSSPVGTACFALKAHARHRAWSTDGVWPDNDDPRTQRWERRARVALGSGVTAFAILMVSFVLW